MFAYVRCHKAKLPQLFHQIDGNQPGLVEAWRFKLTEGTKKCKILSDS